MVEKVVNQLEVLFPEIQRDVIESVLASYWRDDDRARATRQTIVYLQVVRQLEKPQLNQPWTELVRKLQEAFPLASTVKIEDVLKDYWVYFPKYETVFELASQDPRLTGQLIPVVGVVSDTVRVQKVDGRLVIVPPQPRAARPDEEESR